MMFRNGQVITRDGTRSDTDFCAYHSTTTYAFTSLRYAVLPDTASDAGCGSSPGNANFTAVASHELVESITDPDVGLGTLGWYDSDNGEISDICEDDPSGFSGVIEGYTVVSNWSNEAHSCVLSGLPRTISVGGGAILEGDSNTRTLQIPVTLSQPSHFTVTVHYSLQNISARARRAPRAGVDFLTKSGTVTFKPSSSTGLTAGRATDLDHGARRPTHESNESFSVRLSSPSLGYAIARSSGTGTILNDDVATVPLGVSVGDATIMVAMNGNHLLSFPVTLSHAVSSTVTVRFTFSHSTANYGVDYTGTKTGTVTIRPGGRQGTASITVLASSTITQTRALIVTLSSLHAPVGSKLVHQRRHRHPHASGLLTGRLASRTRRRVILTARSSSVRRGEHHVASDEQRVTDLCDDLLAKHDPKATPPAEFLGAQYDLGLAWVHFPEGFGGLGLSPKLQNTINGKLFGRGRADSVRAQPDRLRHVRADARDARHRRAEGSATSARCSPAKRSGARCSASRARAPTSPALERAAVRDGDEWVVNGQKVWTTLAHVARFGIVLVRTDPEKVKHKGMTMFVLDMQAPGVEVRPLVQATGEAEFNEVYMTDVRIPDAERLGDIGEGWHVSLTTLMNERVSIGGQVNPRGSGVIAVAMNEWKRNPQRQDAVARDALTRLWIDAEVNRLTNMRARRRRGPRERPVPRVRSASSRWPASTSGS